MKSKGIFLQDLEGSVSVAPSRVAPKSRPPSFHLPPPPIRHYPIFITILYAFFRGGLWESYVLGKSTFTPFFKLQYKHWDCIQIKQVLEKYGDYSAAETYFAQSTKMKDPQRERAAKNQRKMAQFRVVTFSRKISRPPQKACPPFFAFWIASFWSSLLHQAAISTLIRTCFFMLH